MTTVIGVVLEISERYEPFQDYFLRAHSMFFMGVLSSDLLTNLSELNGNPFNFGNRGALIDGYYQFT